MTKPGSTLRPAWLQSHQSRLHPTRRKPSARGGSLGEGQFQSRVLQTERRAGERRAPLGTRGGAPGWGWRVQCGERQEASRREAGTDEDRPLLPGQKLSLLPGSLGRLPGIQILD